MQNDSNSKTESKDLRPAVFIKDLKKRSAALEEEKTEHFLRIKKERSQRANHEAKPAAEQVQASNTTSAAEHIRNLEAAIAQKDAKILSEAIYNAKIIQLEVKNEKNSAALQDLVSRAESHMVEATAKVK